MAKLVYKRKFGTDEIITGVLVEIEGVQTVLYSDKWHQFSEPQKTLTRFTSEWTEDITDLRDELEETIEREATTRRDEFAKRMEKAKELTIESILKGNK